MSEVKDLIVVRQLPIIEQNLKLFSEEIDKQVAVALSMGCTEDTYKDVKRVRAELNKKFDAADDQFKPIMTAIRKPYDDLKAAYDECVTNKRKSVDAAMKGKINLVTDGLKDQMTEKVKAYYDEYAKSVNVDFVAFDRSGVSVTMSASEKSLKEACKAFLDGVSDGLAMIETQEYRDEILVEFKRTLNAAQAVSSIVDRHRLIQAEKEQAERRAAAEEDARHHAAEVLAAIPEAPAPISAPTVIVSEKKYRMTFTVVDTKDKLIALKKFLNDGGYQYE